jgi:putative NIF3 family GTP cyclohydrolase 1 type 2
MPYTIKQVIALIIGREPEMHPVGTCDFFHAGDPDAKATGVVVTFLATRPVLARAVELGCNLIITHEPTFYQDGSLDNLRGDVIVESKRQFITDHSLAIWRCHDYLHHCRPDGILAGMARLFGWTAYQSATDQVIFDLPATTLGEVAQHLKRVLGGPVLRVMGDPSWPVRRVALSCGANSFDNHRAVLRRDGVDTLVCGEQREWQTCEYVRDSVAAGHPQGLIVLGHRNSEEAGMELLAESLKSRIKDLPVEYVPAGDPFWYE